MKLHFRDYLAMIEGLFTPDRPAFAGASRINVSLFPRSRYRLHPHLRPPAPKKPPAPPSPPRPGVKLRVLTPAAW